MSKINHDSKYCTTTVRLSVVDSASYMTRYHLHNWVGLIIPELQPWSWPPHGCSYETTTMLRVSHRRSYCSCCQALTHHAPVYSEEVDKDFLFFFLLPPEDAWTSAEPLCSSIAFSKPQLKATALFWSFCDKVPLPMLRTHLKWTFLCLI